MPLPKSFTTVTTFSKLLAMFLFILFPFVGFYLGVQYEKDIHFSPQINKQIPIYPNPTPSSSINFKTYSDKSLHYSFQYPNNWYEGAHSKGFVIDHNENQDVWQIGVGFVYPPQSNQRGVTYCLANPDDLSRCEKLKINQSISASIDWDIVDGRETQAIAEITHPEGGIVVLSLTPVTPSTKAIFRQILSTFKFNNQTAAITPQISCRPRPACLDATPRCMIPETSDMCPRRTNPLPEQVACTQDAMLCPDGSYVSRIAPHCEFTACPK